MSWSQGSFHIIPFTAINAPREHPNSTSAQEVAPLSNYAQIHSRGRRRPLLPRCVKPVQSIEQPFSKPDESVGSHSDFVISLEDKSDGKKLRGEDLVHQSRIGNIKTLNPKERSTRQTPPKRKSTCRPGDYAVQCSNPVSHPQAIPCGDLQFIHYSPFETSQRRRDASDQWNGRTNNAHPEKRRKIKSDLYVHSGDTEEKVKRDMRGALSPPVVSRIPQTPGKHTVSTQQLSPPHSSLRQRSSPSSHACQQKHQGIITGFGSPRQCGTSNALSTLKVPPEDDEILQELAAPVQQPSPPPSSLRCKHTASENPASEQVENCSPSISISPGTARYKRAMTEFMGLSTRDVLRIRPERPEDYFLDKAHQFQRTGQNITALPAQVASLNDCREQSSLRDCIANKVVHSRKAEAALLDDGETKLALDVVTHQAHPTRQNKFQQKRRRRAQQFQEPVSTIEGRCRTSHPIMLPPVLTSLPCQAAEGKQASPESQERIAPWRPSNSKSRKRFKVRMAQAAPPQDPRDGNFWPGGVVPTSSNRIPLGARIKKPTSAWGPETTKAHKNRKKAFVKKVQGAHAIPPQEPNLRNYCVRELGAPRKPAAMRSGKASSKLLNCTSLSERENINSPRPIDNYTAAELDAGSVPARFASRHLEAQGPSPANVVEQESMDKAWKAEHLSNLPDVGDKFERPVEIAELDATTPSSDGRPRNIEKENIPCATAAATDKHTQRCPASSSRSTSHKLKTKTKTKTSKELAKPKVNERKHQMKSKTPSMDGATSSNAIKIASSTEATPRKSLPAPKNQKKRDSDSPSFNLPTSSTQKTKVKWSKGLILQNEVCTASTSAVATKKPVATMAQSGPSKQSVGPKSAKVVPATTKSKSAPKMKPKTPDVAAPKKTAKKRAESLDAAIAQDQRTNPRPTYPRSDIHPAGGAAYLASLNARPSQRIERVTNPDVLATQIHSAAVEHSCAKLTELLKVIGSENSIGTQRHRLLSEIPPDVFYGTVGTRESFRPPPVEIPESPAGARARHEGVHPEELWDWDRDIAPYIEGMLG